MAKMKRVQPQLAAVRERFPDDKAKQQQATMELYKQEKINPVAGCLPMVVQIPVFFALYKVIFITIEMRHAPFFGWIKDLSSPDPTSVFNLFGLIPWTPPHPLMIGVWPLIMGVSMFLQMKMNPEPPDPVQKTMFTYMPLVFTYMLSSFSVGPRDLLDLEQYPLGHPTRPDHAALRHQNRAVGQSRQHVRAKTGLVLMEDRSSDAPDFVEDGRPSLRAGMHVRSWHHDSRGPAACLGAGNRLRGPLQRRANPPFSML